MEKFILISVCEREIVTTQYYSLEQAQKQMHEEMIECGNIPKKIVEFGGEYDECEVREMGGWSNICKDPIDWEIIEVSDGEWFGVVRWCNEDIKFALADHGFSTCNENVDAVRASIESNHHFTERMVEAGWESIGYAIEDLDGLKPAEKEPGNDTIYTRREAAEILDMFDDLLDQYGVTIPSPEDLERGEGNTARLYGSPYFYLLDAVEDALNSIAERAKSGSNIVKNRLGA